MRGRKRSGAWAAVMIPLLIALVAIVLFKYLFVVRNVSISGDRDVSDEAITRAARISFGSSIFLVDEDQMRAGVNALGAVRLNAVQKRYPNTLLLDVSRREPRAMLLYLGEIRILDGEGCVVGSAPTVPNTDLIYVNGMSVTAYAPGEPLQAGKGQLEAYCSIMQALDANQAVPYASEIELSDVSALKLITRNGITVELGDAKNMQDKIAWMRSAVADLEMRNEGGGTLDVRSGTKADYSRPGGVVATPAPVETPAVPAG